MNLEKFGFSSSKECLPPNKKAKIDKKKRLGIKFMMLKKETVVLFQIGKAHSHGCSMTKLTIICCAHTAKTTPL